MLHNGVLPAMRVLAAPGLTLPLQEMQQDDPEIAFQGTPHVVAQVPNLLNQVVQIDGVKLSGTQGGTGLQTPEVKVLFVQLRISAHRGYSSSTSTRGQPLWCRKKSCSSICCAPWNTYQPYSTPSGAACP